MYFDKIGEFLSKPDPISGLPIAFLWAAAELNNRGTLKVCKKITKIAQTNSGFILGDGANPMMKFPSEILKLSI